MTRPFSTLQTLTLICTLASSWHAMANSNDELIAARDAYRSNNLSKLSAIVSDMPDNYPLKDYPAYWLTLKALDKDNDRQIVGFLNSVREGWMPEKIRNEWLKKLGKREDWGSFAAEWKKLPAEARDEESICYGQLLDVRQGRKPDDLNRFLDMRAAPDGCNQLITAAAAQGMLSQDWLWRRERLLLAGNFVSQARQLADATNLPLDNASLNNPASASPTTPGGQEAIVYGIVSKARSDISGAAARLSAIEASLSKDRSAFAWGQLALLSARKQIMGQALQWYAKADPQQLTSEQWEWWARAALRGEQWAALEQITRNMPMAVANKPAWQYWRARSLKQLGRGSEAPALFAKASSGHHYYALLSLEELGNTLSTPASKTVPSNADIAAMRANPAIQRALALLDISNSEGRAELRSDAQREWRWAMRGRNDMELLAAAEIGRREAFYDMAIYSAERTKEDHDYSLRYLTPYRDVTQRYARQLNVDDAWVYGLIRQESRFITAARSGVGASGLMQLMPATAKWVAKKMGLGNYSVTDIETNVQLGTWYLRYVRDSLSGNEVMATAAYNAGPARARAWQDSRPLDGTIYAETIPFSETRDYVQKVMANAAYYASTFGHDNISLKTRMGTIPAR